MYANVPNAHDNSLVRLSARLQPPAGSSRLRFEREPSAPGSFECHGDQVVKIRLGRRALPTEPIVQHSKILVKYLT